MLSFALLVLGLVLLLTGGAGLVRGASGIAESFGISPLIVGLTVVAFGTSSPELVVNVIGAFQGQTDIAFGNVAGSNIANLGLVLGFAALITPITLEGQVIRREVPLLMLATTILLVMTLDPYIRGFSAILDRSDGLVLFLLFGIFVYIMINDVIRQQRDPLLATVEGLSPKLEKNTLADWAFTIGGVIGLAIGGQLTIDNGVKLAEMFNIAPELVGMMVIAIGTSMPELVTSIIAAMRKEADLCVGNVVGSNIFNSLFVLPISAMVQPLRIPDGGVYDIIASLAFAAILIPIFIMRNRMMSRTVGCLFLACYVGYMSSRLMLGLGTSDAF